MKNSLELGLGALVLSAVLATSGCEVCTSARRMPQAQGCYQPSFQNGCYQQAPAQTECYTPAVCSPAATVK